MERKHENYFVWLFNQLKGWPVQNYCLWFFAFGFTIIEADRCPASLRAWHRLSRDHRKRRISHDEAHFHLEAGAG